MYLGLQKSKINVETKVLVSCDCLTFLKNKEKKLSLSTENNKVSLFTRRDKISFIYSNLSL